MSCRHGDYGCGYVIKTHDFFGGGDYIILGAFYNPNEITHLKEF